MQVLAHRGLWNKRSEQNTLPALLAALAAGHGIETDLRDGLGRLVVSHDPPPARALPLTDLLDGVRGQEGRPGGFLAWNIKADGLAGMCREALADLLPRSFFFDMSVPDQRQFLAQGLPVFTRHSDVETAPSYYSEACGVWLDELSGAWLRAPVIEQHLRNGKQVAVVSAEIHGRSHRDQWQMLKCLPDNPKIMLCTDLVDEAFDFFLTA